MRAGDGVAAFTRPAFLLTERLVERGKATLRDFRQAKPPADLFTKCYREAYNQVYHTQLTHEAKQLQVMEEAEMTADLQPPYSVQRAIIAETAPELVALSVFDFGLADTSPTRLYFENYTPKTDAQPIACLITPTGGCTRRRSEASTTTHLAAWIEPAVGVPFVSAVVGFYVVYELMIF